jgi:hypothetical protein
MKSPTPSTTLVKRGLARPPVPKPTSPAMSRRGRWSPPLPQG